ncbi:MAG: low affinity iron permease family protein [Candidatus Saccharibacteria bacterium]|nr:low affinity iron permease family protein [Candidatus Saccharibacteria bacterium]
MNHFFRIVAKRVSQVAGSPFAFLIALVLVAIWAFSGTYFSYSDTWQLVINTGTTIVTFLMVFLIQNTQNRDGKAMQLKLDELIRASKARDSFVDLENLTDQELLEIDEQFKELHKKQKTPEALHKLHSKIQAEHQRRHSLRGAGKALQSFLHKSDKNSK